LPAREQVAAVCYRVNGQGIEFLLVQTRSGRWTFPKGCVEPGLTHAQTAALEAFEEAGVHGRIEEASFARYIGRKRRGKHHSAPTELAVKAHLCEVSHLGSPQESKRNPTWFPVDKAKRRLRADRMPDDAAELLRVIDRAATRIQRLRAATHKPTDALQQVQFEASPQMGFRSYIRTVSFTPDLQGVDGDRKRSSALYRNTRLKLLPKACPPQSDAPPEPRNS
jgi:8-oxo-dGTP pyrophosphatase MutT (NUDIX family)